MAFYMSERAALELGVPESSEFTEKNHRGIFARLCGMKAERSSEYATTRETTLEERLTLFLQGQQRQRNIAKSLHEAVEITQLMNISIDLDVGRMRFLRVPGTQYSSTGVKNNVEAFWAYGIEPSPEYMRSVAETRLILVGSLDGLTSTAWSAEASMYNEFSFPSDPSFMIELLNGELELEVDLEDYEHETEWTPDDSTNGHAAQTAMDMTHRAYGQGPGKRGSWALRSLPRQRVVAVVSDIHVDTDESRTVLARPVCISATV